jgi:hypothetical protein
MWGEAICILSLSHLAFIALPSHRLVTVLTHVHIGFKKKFKSKKKQKKTKKAWHLHCAYMHCEASPAKPGQVGARIPRHAT